MSEIVGWYPAAVAPPEHSPDDTRSALQRLIGDDDGAELPPFAPGAIALERDDAGTYVLRMPSGPRPLTYGNRPGVTLYDTPGDAITAAARILEANGAELIWCFR